MTAVIANGALGARVQQGAEAAVAAKEAGGAAPAGKVAVQVVKTSAPAKAASGAAASGAKAPVARTVASRASAAAAKVQVPSKGYATASKATTASKSTTASKTTASSTSKTYTSDYAFMSDTSLSAQEKLILFLALQKKTAGKELEALLDKATAKKEAAAKKGSSLFDVAKAVVSPLGFVDKLLGGKLEGLLKQVSGPMLGAAATALGMPALAPIAMTVGPQLLSAVLDAPVAGESSASTSSSSGGGKGGELDEVELARVQLLQKRMEEWTTLASNLMQSFHQTRMSVLANLR